MVDSRTGTSVNSGMSTISVVTAVFNGERWIARTVKSILDQNVVGLEYVIVNDGSTDNTLQVLAEISIPATCSFHVISQPNSGEARAVNAGLENITGDYVCVVSADDPLLPGHLVSMMRALEERQDAVVAYPDWLMIDEDERVIREVETLDYDQRALISDVVCIPGPGAVIRRSALEGKALRDPIYRYVSDYDAWLRLSLKGNFVRVRQSLAMYRVHSGQATVNGRGAAMATEIEEVVSNFFAMKLPPDVQKMERRARAFAHYYAALQNLHDSSVRGRGRMVRSLILQPPFPVRRRTHRRNPIAIAAVLGSPLGTWLYRWLSENRRQK